MARRVSRLYDQHLAEAGLTGTQYSTLANLSVLGPIGQRALAQHLGLDASTLARNLRLMVDQGWIRQEKGADARSHALALTETGRARLAEGRRCWRQAQQALGALLGIERVAALHEVLDEGLAILSQHQDIGGESDPSEGPGARAARPGSD